MLKIKEKLEIKSKYIVYIIGIIVIVLDQLSKFLITNNLDIAQELSIIPKFFSLYYVTNTGAAFSSLENQRTFLIIVTVFCVALITTIIEKEKLKSKLTIVSLGLLIGGIVSNFIDRLVYKKVIDFLSFTFFSYKFAVFNIADVCIVLGAFIYMLISLKEDMCEKRK